jgi:sec-independent protein translocase protein TatC
LKETDDKIINSSQSEEDNPIPNEEPVLLNAAGNPLPDSKPQSGKKMSFTSHLEELRQAIIISFLSIILTTGICFTFNKQVLNILTAPLTNNVKNVQLIFVSPGEAFMSTLQTALITGLILALPVILNRIYWFVAPGLTSQEKRFSFPVLIVSYFLFLVGVVFAYFILLPFGVKFLVEFAPENIHPMISIGNYISFSSSLILGTGLIFELPMILLFLAFIRIINAGILIRNRKYAFLVSFIIGAIITPSIDMITQTLLAGALYILYELSIIMIRALELTRSKKEVM